MSRFAYVDAPDDATSSGGGLLASTSRDHASIQSVATTSTSFADVDATNLAVTFEVPDSGEVIVVMNAIVGNSSVNSAFWGLREGGANVAGSDMSMWQIVGAARVTYHCKITGLTPGASKTWKWSHAVNGGATFTLYYGAELGPATMEVWEVPLA